MDRQGETIHMINKSPISSQMSDSVLILEETDIKEEHVNSQGDHVSQMFIPHAINHVDCIRMRNGLTEILEELKLRRNNDVENEDQIRYLVQEKYELERKLDTAKSHLITASEDNDKKAKEIKRQYDDQIKSLQTEVKQNDVFKECTQKETKALKDDIRNLQLTNYNLEKKLKEQGRKLQFQTSSANQHLHQLSSAEEKFQSVSAYCKKLCNSQERLARSVKEAIKLNKELMYTNEHQKCIISLHKREITQLQNQLLDAKVKLDLKPEITSSKQQEEELFDLKEQLVNANHELTSMKKDLHRTSENYKEIVLKLQDSHKLIERHLQNAEEYKRETINLTTELGTSKDKLNKLQTAYHLLNKDLATEKSVHTESVERWQKEEKDLNLSILKLKEDLEIHKVAKTELEQLNTAWAQQNVKLTEELEAAKAILDRPKEDGEYQTILCMLNTSDTASQVMPELSTLGSQTEQARCYHIPIQTDPLPCSDVCVQTYTPALAVNATQTKEPPLINRSAQTDESIGSNEDGVKISHVQHSTMIVNEASGEPGQVSSQNVEETLDTALCNKGIEYGTPSKDKILKQEFEYVPVYKTVKLQNQETKDKQIDHTGSQHPVETSATNLEHHLEVETRLKDQEISQVYTAKVYSEIDDDSQQQIDSNDSATVVNKTAENKSHSQLTSEQQTDDDMDFTSSQDRMYRESQEMLPVERTNVTNELKKPALKGNKNQQTSHSSQEETCSPGTDKDNIHAKGAFSLNNNFLSIYKPKTENINKTVSTFQSDRSVKIVGVQDQMQQKSESLKRMEMKEHDDNQFLAQTSAIDQLDAAYTCTDAKIYTTKSACQGQSSSKNQGQRSPKSSETPKKLSLYESHLDGYLSKISSSSTLQNAVGRKLVKPRDNQDLPKQPKYVEFLQPAEKSSNANVDSKVRTPSPGRRGSLSLTKKRGIEKREENDTDFQEPENLNDNKRTKCKVITNPVTDISPMFGPTRLQGGLRSMDQSPVLSPYSRYRALLKPREDQMVRIKNKNEKAKPRKKRGILKEFVVEVPEKDRKSVSFSTDIVQVKMMSPEHNMSGEQVLFSDDEEDTIELISSQDDCTEEKRPRFT